MALWEEFLQKLGEGGAEWEEVALSTPETMAEILTELGYSGLKRGKLETEWRKRSTAPSDTTTQSESVAPENSPAARGKKATEAAVPKPADPASSDDDDAPLVTKGKRQHHKKAASEDAPKAKKARAAQKEDAKAPAQPAGPVIPRRSEPTFRHLVRPSTSALPDLTADLGGDPWRVPMVGDARRPVPTTADSLCVTPGGLAFCPCGNLITPSGTGCATCSYVGIAVERVAVSTLALNQQRPEVDDEFAVKLVDSRAITSAFCERCWKATPCHSDSKQTRSADEGLTMFYTCTVCKYSWLEYS